LGVRVPPDLPYFKYKEILGMPFFDVYRKGQGIYSRVIVGIVLGILALFASISLHNVLVELPNVAEKARIPLIDISLTWGLICAFALFVFLGFVICVCVVGLETGIRPIDTSGKKAVELLIDTQAELQKVAWPTRYELVGSTAVVIISVILIGVFILGVDWFVSVIMKYIGVL
jgi:preprotein translocase SecE subunit